MHESHPNCCARCSTLRNPGRHIAQEKSCRRSAQLTRLVNESFAFDTDNGLVVGQLSGPLSTRAFVWTAARGMRAITPTTVNAVATSIANGRVVGWYASADTNGQRVFLWTAERGLVDVTPRGLNGIRPVGIDAQGRIAILYEDENPLNTRSFVLVPRGL